MSAIHGVEGLIKWTKGDEWRNDFETVFDRRVGPACRGAGVELEELADNSSAYSEAQNNAPEFCRER